MIGRFDDLRAVHPRRAGIGDAIARSFPIADDREAQAERRLAHRLDLAEAIRK